MSRSTRSKGNDSANMTMAVVSPPTQPSSEESEESDSEDSDSGGTSVSSVPDATGAFRRKYNRLIDDCRKLEKKEGFSPDVQEVMTKNIESASSLFQQLSHPNPHSDGPSSSSRPRAFSENVGSAPGDIYMAFLHTKMISDVLRSKTDSIGASNSGFKMDEFIVSLKRKSTSEESGAYSSKIAARFLAMEFASASKTLPPLTAVVGSFDRDAISVPKEKKPRAPIVRKRFDDVEKTQEEVNLTNNKSEGPQKLALHLMHTLKKYTRSQNKPTTLYEFVLDPTSLNKSIESIFYVAFLVHDGLAALHKPAGSTMNDFAIEVRPEDKKKEGEQAEQTTKSHINSRRNTRNQYILSFSARTFKKISQIAIGDPVIPIYNNLDELTQD